MRRKQKQRIVNRLAYMIYDYNTMMNPNQRGNRIVLFTWGGGGDLWELGNWEMFDFLVQDLGSKEGGWDRLWNNIAA